MTYFYEVKKHLKDKTCHVLNVQKADEKFHPSHLFHILSINCNFSRINPNMIVNKFSFIYFYFALMKSNGKWRSFWFYYGGFMCENLCCITIWFTPHSNTIFQLICFFLSGIKQKTPFRNMSRGELARCSQLAKHIIYLPMFKSSQQTWLLSKIAF